MNKLENKNVEVRFEKTSEHSIKQGFRIFWNDKPESKWDTYAKRTKTYKRESKWASCWEEIVKSFNRRTKPKDISRIVRKYTKTEGQYYD